MSDDTAKPALPPYTPAPTSTSSPETSSTSPLPPSAPESIPTASNTYSYTYTATSPSPNANTTQPIHITLNGIPPSSVHPTPGVPINIDIRLNPNGEVEHYSYNSALGWYTYTANPPPLPYTVTHTEQGILLEHITHDHHTTSTSTSTSHHHSGHTSPSPPEETCKPLTQNQASEPLLQKLPPSEPRPEFKPQKPDAREKMREEYRKRRPKEGWCCWSYDRCCRGCEECCKCLESCCAA
ncbi:hypothetical protein ABW19_dt0210597 [Dactylella cylindrospora]|nr:hypothetical protein ABW19_dt0210597 [Dactylella cylindrospora]